MVIGLLAAVSPVSVMFLIALMLKKNPLRNAIFFLIGFTLMLVVIGLVFGIALQAGGSGKKSHVDAYIDIALGAVCIVLIPMAFRKKKNQEPAKEPVEVKPLRALITGIVVMSVNLSTIMAFLVGVHAITSAHGLSTLGHFIAGIVLLFFSLLSLLVPIALDIAFPKTAEKVLTATRNWLTKYGQWVGAAILLLFGVVLLIQGIKVVV
jgi:cytochrome c biogenesis protein CcdA